MDINSNAKHQEMSQEEGWHSRSEAKPEPGRHLSHGAWERGKERRGLRSPSGLVKGYAIQRGCVGGIEEVPAREIVAGVPFSLYNAPNRTAQGGKGRLEPRKMQNKGEEGSDSTGCLWMSTATPNIKR